jgi:hypothetical protein
MAEWSRRELLSGGFVMGALGMGGGWPTFAAASADDPVAVRLQGPEAQLRQIVRMQGSLREEDVPWWFTGVIFAVTGDRATPQPLVRFEGMEIYWFRHLSDGYQLGGHTLTFFRDYDSNAYLREFRNPWTGRTDEVKPAVQGGNLGFKYSAHGIWPVRLNGEAFGEPGSKPLALQWHSMRDQVWMQHQTVYPPGMPPMHGQRQTMFAPRDKFLDQRVDALPAVFASTVFMGWLKWMDMAQRPGHVIWHACRASTSSARSASSLRG